jgi:hypothetical protein
MNETKLESHGAVAGQVERGVRRPAGMPEYTDEQKAAAFDALWETCGLGQGLLKDWVSRDISRPGCPPNEATVRRVPRYTFEILAEGDMLRFRDVLHHLATRI